jgi:hypothetical protein
MRSDHKDLIMEIPNFVSKSFCKHLIEKFEALDNKKPGSVLYNGVEEVIPELKNSMETGCICCLPGWKYEYDEIRDYIRQAVELYMHHLSNDYHYDDQPRHTFYSLFLKELDEIVPNIHKQPRGGKYAWHYDYQSLDNGNGNIHLGMLMIYLNTLEPHEGGCTEFGHGRKIIPECGKIVLWPATWAYPHCGNEVKCDAKYTVVVPITLKDKVQS